MSDTWHRWEIEAGGTKLSGLERASGEPATEPPILLLHGLIAEAATFRALMSGLPANRRVLAMDLPGAGYSSHPTSRDVSFAGIAAVVRAAIAALHLEKPVLLGHSHGGAVALRLAASEPDLLSAMVLVCPAHPFSGRERMLVNFYLSLPGKLFAHVLPKLPTWLHLMVFKRMPGSRGLISREQIAPYLHTLRLPGLPKHMLRLLAHWHEDMHSLGADLQSAPLRVPTLLLWGDEDIVVPMDSSEGLLPTLANAVQINLRGVGHLPNEEAPEECAMHISRWLEAQSKA